MGIKAIKNNQDFIKVKEQLFLQDRVLLDSARKDFRTFVKLAFSAKLASSGNSEEKGFDFNFLNEIIIEELENLIISTDVHNLMIFAPPRVGKTTLSSILFPAYLIGKFSEKIVEKGGPKFEIMCGGYNEKLASITNTETQSYIDNPVFKSIFPSVRIPDSHGYFMKKRYKKTGSYFETIGDISQWNKGKRVKFKYHPNGTPPKLRATASYRTICPGGAVTGMGFSLGILDDMVKDPSGVERKLAREQLYNWYTSTFSTRGQHFNKMHPKTIMLMTRWHHDDLPGRVLKMTEKSKEKSTWFRVVSLPAEGYRLNDKRRHPKDPRPPGKVLPVRGMNRAYFNTRKIQLGAYYAPLFQQDPTKASGEFIKKKWIKRYKTKDLEHIQFNLIIGSADFSFDNVETGSFNVFLRAGVVFNEPYNQKSAEQGRKPNFIQQSADIYILDCIREKMDYVEAREALRKLLLQYNDWNAGFHIEQAANAYAIKSEFGVSSRKQRGLEAYEDLRLNLPFIELSRPKDSKRVRLVSNIGVLKYGKLYVLDESESDWTDDFVEELLEFPKAPNDDCVDALSIILSQVNKKQSEMNRMSILSY